MIVPAFNALCELSLVGRKAIRKDSLQLIEYIDRMIAESRETPDHVAQMMTSDFVDVVADLARDEWIRIHETKGMEQTRNKAESLLRYAFEHTRTYGNFFKNTIPEEAVENLL